MAVYNWSELVDGQVLAFDPAIDVLHFDSSIRANDLDVDYLSSSIVFTYLDKSITLSTAPGTLGIGNLTFDLLGNFVIGDGTTGTADDGLGNTITGTSSTDQLAGLGGDDYLSGGGANDVLVGGTGRDTLDGGTGADTLIGGDDDVFIVDNANDVIVNAFGSPGGAVIDDITDTVVASVDYVLDNFVAHIILVGAANNATGNAWRNRVTGNANDNILDGLGNNDTLDGGAGNDSLQGGSGSDVMSGGAGDDTYVVSGSGDQVIETSNDAGASSPGSLALPGGVVDTVEAAIDYALGNFVENLTLTGSAVNGTGNELDNVLTGNADADRLVGLDGDDTLNGGAGGDTMEGGSGSDVYIVNAGLDVVIELAGQGNDLVKSSVTVTLAGNVERLTLTGTNDIDGTGNGLNNTLTGNAGDNVLRGGSGNDTLIGGGGNDILLFSSNDGSFQGGSGGADSIKIEGAGRNIDLTALPNTLITGIEIIRLSGSGDNTLTLNVNDVLAMSGTDTVRVDGNTGDVVHRGGGWSLGANQVIGANTYRTYTQDTATLLVDTNITSVV